MFLGFDIDVGLFYRVRLCLWFENLEDPLKDNVALILL